MSLILPKNEQKQLDLRYHSKGQLISECLRYLEFSKKSRKNLTNFCSSDQINKIKVFSYNNIIYTGYLLYKVMIVCLWFDHFLDSRAEICHIFRWFFGKLKKFKRHSEINWLWSWFFSGFFWKIQDTKKDISKLIDIYYIPIKLRFSLIRSLKDSEN